MKRLALVLVLAAAVPATGCHGECARSVTVDWPSFRLVGGDTSSCVDAGVRTIDVWVNDAYVATFDCNGPAGEVGVARGANLVTVEARDASDVIRLRDEVQVSGSGCGNLGVVDARPAEGRVDVNYQLPAPGTCVAPGPSYMWVYVRDEIANEIAADSAAFPTQYQCGSAISFRLAAGDYTLLRTQEMVPSGGGYATVGADCAHHPFTVSPGGAVGVPATLLDASSSCP